MSPSRKKHADCADRVLALMKIWLEYECQTRCPELRFHDWGQTAYVGPLAGESLDVLCASPDARRMCEWIDEQTGHEATLLMACAAAEMLGLKPSNFTKGN